MTTDKLNLYEVDLSVSGWDAIFNADIQKIDDGISTIEVLEYGETIAAYEAVYIKSDGKAWLAEADGTKQPAFGIAIDAGVSTDEKRIRTNGHIENSSWAWTEIGGYIYLDGSTPGALTDTEPASNAQPLGTIMSATEIFVFVSNNIGSSTSNFLTVKDEGSVLDTAVTSINFIGAGVTAVENLSHEIDVTIVAGSAPVDTVNGQTGTVVLDADDISDAATINKFATAADLSKLAGIATGAEVNNISDVNATDLTDGGDTTLHDHDGIAENTAHRATTTGNPHSVTYTEVGSDPTGTDNSTDVTLNASATTGGLSLSGQEISNRAATNAQSGYVTASHITAIEANTVKATNVSTNITVVEAPTNVSIQSSDGTNDTIAAADTTNAGVMTTAMYDEHVLNTAKVSLTDNSVTLAKMAPGTDGNLITYDAAGDPAHIATGTSTHVLTSNGAGAAPTFQAATGGYTPGTPIAMEDAVISRPKLLDVSETVNALGDLGGGTDDIDLEDGNVVTATVSTAAQTLTFSNPPATGSNGSFTLFLTNGGSQTITWPTSVDWAKGTAPTLTASGIDVIVFTTNDGGTTWIGLVAGLDVK